MSVAFDLPQRSRINNLPALISPWTDALISELGIAWAAGKSGAAIARDFNERYGFVFTRSAIIGKVHRLGLPQRACGAPAYPRIAPEERAQRRLEKLQRRAEVRAAKAGFRAERMVPKRRAPLPPVIPNFDLLIPMEQRKTFAELGTRDCRWIIGDPQEPSHFYCGGGVLGELPYCAGHCARSYYRRDR